MRVVNTKVVNLTPHRFLSLLLVPGGIVGLYAASAEVAKRMFYEEERPLTGRKSTASNAPAASGRIAHIVGPALALFLFALAILVLYHTLRQYHVQDIARSLSEIPPHRIWLSLGLTGLSYLVLSGYDALAFRYIRNPLPYLKIVLASFIGYAFATNTGTLSVITSSGVRYRLYAGWGLSAVDIAKVIRSIGVSLGIAPLSGLEDRELAPLWNRIGAFLFRHGEHFYNFQGLRDYKDKFEPVWEPRYLGSPGGFALPRILMDLASLVSRGLKGVVAKPPGKATSALALMRKRGKINVSSPGGVDSRIFCAHIANSCRENSRTGINY